MSREPDDWRDDPKQHAFVDCCCSHNASESLHCWWCAELESEHVPDERPVEAAVGPGGQW